MKKTTLVFGGAGFIGSNFIHLLLRTTKYNVVNVDALTYAGNRDNLASVSKNSRYSFIRGDITDQAQLRRIFDKVRPLFVINFAAETHVDRSIHEGASIFLRTNAGGVLNLLEEVRRTGVKKFVQVSTDEVYGSLPLGGKTRFTETTPLAPNSPYAASKAAGDLLCRSYFETFGVPVVITRCSNNFGPYQYPEKLIPFMILRTLAGKKLTMYGDGLNVRDWIYVEDHCRALLLCLLKGKAGAVYNIGADNERSNLEIARRINNHFKRDDSAIIYTADRPGHDRRYAIDSGKIQRELGWKPKTDFDRVFKSTILWYLNNPAWLERLMRRPSSTINKHLTH